MRPMGLLVILFDRELRCEFIQQIAMGTPSHGGAGQQSMSARTGIRSANTMVKPLRRACPFQFREVLLPIISKPRWLNTYHGL